MAPEISLLTLKYFCLLFALTVWPVPPRRDDEPDRLLRAVIAVAMHDTDWRFAQDLCVRLSSHQNCHVRGNAILGFGHIARIHRQLDCDSVQPIIKAALCDADGYIRGHGADAADDTAQFLGWNYD